MNTGELGRAAARADDAARAAGGNRRTSAPSATRRWRARGQSLVEFALVLPVLLFMVLMVLDFGRVYLGYINLQSMARTAANYAANNPVTWSATPAKYRQQALNDASAINCDTINVADPLFVDANGDGSTTSLGDSVTVTVGCRFHLVTPIVSSMFSGGFIPVTASAVFPVKTGMSATAAAGAPAAVAPSAAFMGNTVVANTTTTPTISGVTPLAVDFRDTSGGSPTAWSWNFGSDPSGVATPGNSTSRDNLGVQFTCAAVSCTFNVSMTATNAQGSSTAHMTVNVGQTPTADFTFTPGSPNKGQNVTFTASATAGATSYSWSFGDSSNGSGATVTHSYSNGGTFTVTLTVNYPSPATPVVVPKSLTVTNNCTVPSLNGVRFNNAQAAWTAAGFTGTVSRDTGAPAGNFLITAQTLTATQVVACSSSVKVSAP